LNTVVKDNALTAKIFTASNLNFTALALEIFNFQYQYNDLYKAFCNTLKIDVATISSLEKIPFLPISFFKSHTVIAGHFEPVAIFESSGTTQTINSKHFVKDISLYQKSFTRAFHLFYGAASDWCILALLPSYLERNNSSLVMMANTLIAQSNHPLSGFYLDDFEKLHSTLQTLEKNGQKTLLVGVTFALLDFAEKFSMRLTNTVIMETGGMKGRRQEMTRMEVHQILSIAFQQEHIHSEYGMTELLSQAYSKGNGIFTTPSWMKILIREEDDPLTLHTANHHKTISGALNIIDLANIYSCPFIATEDAGKLNADGSFEVLGRLDNTDIRGCSLLAL
jgi:phenylacetate-coenzyme A ligase PaaK-like adenylate-forming protein